jgi:hypothetical protein
VTKDFPKMADTELVYTVFRLLSGIGSDRALCQELIDRLEDRQRRIARLEAVAAAAEDVYATMARQDVTAGDLISPMARLREALDAAKDVDSQQEPNP